jgi:hypothetical protein
MQTEALSKYLRTRNTSLPGVVGMLALNKECLEAPTISADIVGRIARSMGLTFEDLARAVAPFEIPSFHA